MPIEVKIEGSKPDFVVCKRVFDVPIPAVAAEVSHCTKCGERIWVAESSPKDPPVVCFQCIEVVIANDKDPEEPTIILSQNSIESPTAQAQAQHLLRAWHQKREGH